jgi:2-methylcitrate dehydratase
MAENDIDPHSIQQVTVKTTTRGADILSDPSKYQPTTKETADHSLPYCIAVALAKGNVLPSDFEEDALKDPFVWELLTKIKVVADPEIDALFPKVKRAIVSVTTTDGKSYSKQEDYAKGDAKRPLSDAELVEKFSANAEQALSANTLNRVVEGTLNLEEFSNIADYMSILKKDR